MSHKANDEHRETITEMFEEFMVQEHAKERPMVLDDDMPDDFEHWLSGLTDDEHNAYVDKFSKLITNSK